MTKFLSKDEVELNAARQHLVERTFANAIIADWRDDRRERIARSQLRMELIGLPDDELDAIVAEAGEYKRLVSALRWLGSRRRP